MMAALPITYIILNAYRKNTSLRFALRIPTRMPSNKPQRFIRFEKGPQNELPNINITSGLPSETLETNAQLISRHKNHSPPMSHYFVVLTIEQGLLRTSKELFGSFTGEHLFTISTNCHESQVDVDGNTIACEVQCNAITAKQAQYRWSILGDEQDPDTFIDDVTQDGNNIDFEFSCNENRCSYECLLNGTEFLCDRNTSLSDLECGDYVLQVNAKDSSNNRDREPATHTWTVEEPASLIGLTLLTHPYPESGDKDAHFLIGFDGNSENAFSLKCSLDDNDREPCEHYVSYDNLINGSHTFTVQAYDCLDRAIEEASLTYTWQINTRDYEESRLKPNNTVAIKGSDFQLLMIPLEQHRPLITLIWQGKSRAVSNSRMLAINKKQYACEQTQLTFQAALWNGKMAIYHILTA